MFNCLAAFALTFQIDRMTMLETDWKYKILSIWLLKYRDWFVNFIKIKKLKCNLFKSIILKLQIWIDY